jgi:large subunit ribosomal protein L2
MKKLKSILPKNSGRGTSGRISVRHRGGRQKRYLREIDFKRDKHDVWGKVTSIEYEPNRNANIALVVYEDGEKRYILAPLGLKEGMKVISSEAAPIEPGNTLPLEKIPAGTQVHNIEIMPKKGGQMVKSAGAAATIQGKEEGWVIVKLPSGEIRRFKPESFATVGQVGNLEVRTRRLRKAGTKRRMGIRPTVRGVAMHPGAHPHGGGEGRSPVGLKYQKRPSGKPAVGKTRKKKKYSDNLIIKPRKPGPHYR